MLRVEDALTLAGEWRPRFADVDNFETSWSRFFDKVGNPTLERLELWLAQDLQRDAAQHVGLVPLPYEPGEIEPEEVHLTPCANELCKMPCRDEFCSQRCVQGLPRLTMREIREFQMAKGLEWSR